MATNNVINAPFPFSPTIGGSGVSSPTDHGILVSRGSAPFDSLVLTDNEILLGSTGNNPVPTLLPSLALFNWVDVAGTMQIGVINTGYIISNASQTIIDVPLVFPQGAVIAVCGKGAGGWILDFPGGQTCHFGNQTTSGAGALVSTNQWDTVYVVCVTANTTFNVLFATGNLDVI